MAKDKEQVASVEQDYGLGATHRRIGAAICKMLLDGKTGEEIGTIISSAPVSRDKKRTAIVLEAFLDAHLPEKVEPEEKIV